MMQLNELRIGNWVTFNDTLLNENHQVEIVGVCKPFMTSPIQILYENKDVKGSNHKLEDFEPILLTEEILLKCRTRLIQSDKDWKYYDIDGFLFDLHISDNKIWFSAFDRDEMQLSNDFNTEIKYLHQLQNLYFVLTGKELSIKL